MNYLKQIEDTARAWYEMHQVDVVPIKYVDLQRLINLLRQAKSALSCVSAYVPPSFSKTHRFCKEVLTAIEKEDYN